MVQEKYCGSSLDGAWKLPTGFILAVRTYVMVLIYTYDVCRCY